MSLSRPVESGCDDYVRTFARADQQRDERLLHELIRIGLGRGWLDAAVRDRVWIGRKAEYTLRSRPPDTSRAVYAIYRAFLAQWRGDLGQVDRECGQGDGADVFQDKSGRVQPDQIQNDWFHASVLLVGPQAVLPPGLVHAHKPLLEHQAESVARLRDWMQGNQRHGVLCLPTGAGKTRTAINFLLRYGLDQGSILWLAHRIELLDQAVATFAELSHEAPRPFVIGRFQAGMLKASQRVDVLVASEPTLTARNNLARVLRQQKDLAWIVVDECHHAVAPGWRRILSELEKARPGARRLGLSATPTRSQERERRKLWDLFDSVVYEARAVDLIRRDVLAKPVIVPVDTGTEYQATPKDADYFARFGDLSPDLLDRIAHDERRNDLVVRQYLDGRARWGKTLVFASNCEQAQFLKGELQASGARVGLVLGNTPPEERQGLLQSFRGGELDVVVNVMVLTEGSDVPGVQTVFCVRPTRSRILFQQMVGRAMRGPKVGGTPQCKVVAFHDHIVGLLSESLASSFADEASALRALELDESTDDEPADREDADADAAEDAAEPPEQGMTISALIEALRAQLRSTQLGDPGKRNPLVGFWELTSARLQRRYILPVFESEKRQIAEWIERSTAGFAAKRTIISTPFATLPEEVVNTFASASKIADSPPRFIELSADRTGALEQVISTLELLCLADEVATTEPPGQAAPHSAQAAEQATTPGLAAPNSWIALAQAAAEHGGNMRFVRTQHGMQAFPTAHVEALLEARSGIERDLRDNVPEARQLLRRRLLQHGLSAEQADGVVALLPATDALQESEPRGPTCAELLDELRRVGPDVRASVVGDLRAAFFAETYSNDEQFLLALIHASEAR